MSGLIVAVVGAFIFTPAADYFYKGRQELETPNSKVINDKRIVKNALPAASTDLMLALPKGEYHLSANKVSELKNEELFIHIGIPKYNIYDSFLSVDISLSRVGEDKVDFNAQKVGAVLIYLDYEVRFMNYDNYYLDVKISRLNK